MHLTVFFNYDVCCLRVPQKAVSARRASFTNIVAQPLRCSPIRFVYLHLRIDVLWQNASFVIGMDMCERLNREKMKIVIPMILMPGTARRRQ